MDSFILIIKNRPNDVYIGCDGITNLRSINDFLIGGTHAWWKQEVDWKIQGFLKKKFTWILRGFHLDFFLIHFVLLPSCILFWIWCTSNTCMYIASLFFLNYFLWRLLWGWKQVGEGDLLCVVNETKKRTRDQELEKMVNLYSGTLNSLLYQYSNALKFYDYEKI